MIHIHSAHATPQHIRSSLNPRLTPALPTPAPDPTPPLTARQSTLDEDDVTSVTGSGTGRGSGAIVRGGGSVGGGSSVAGSLGTMSKREEAALIARGGCDVMFSLAAIQLRFGGHDPGLLASVDGVLAALEEGW